MPTRFRPGDVVVYRRQKSSTVPGSRARDVRPATSGDTYSYVVDKFWRVIDVLPDDTVVAWTRKRKRHTIAAGDPNLRHVRWWERLLFRHRFPPRPTE
jgi:hypothetical protein